MQNLATAPIRGPYTRFRVVEALDCWKKLSTAIAQRRSLSYFFKSYNTVQYCSRLVRNSIIIRIANKRYQINKNTKLSYFTASAVQVSNGASLSKIEVTKH